MNIDDKFFIAGHNGLAGSAFYRFLKKRGFNNIIFRNRNELDLTIQSEVENFFKKVKPDYVILAAAKVGGIHANNIFPAEFIYENLVIQTNVIKSSFENNIKRLLFLGSSCIYPKDIKQPMSEDKILTDVLEPTNEPYALAKIAGIKLCEAFNRQYGTDFRSVMPTNLYGMNDKFNENNSHVIPSLIHRFHKAKLNSDPKVVVWGTGKVKREFMHVDDMVDACIKIFQLDQKTYQNITKPTLSHINIGTGIEITIKDLAETIRDVVGYNGEIIFDLSKPDGPTRKLVDVSILKGLGWSHTTDLKKGLKNTYEWYLQNITQ